MLEKLAPRERQIVDLLYARGSATAVEVRDGLPDPLSDSAVRAMLSRLEAKDYVRRKPSDKGYVYAPAVPEAAAKQSALKQVVSTFFNGSPLGAATALLGMSEGASAGEIEKLQQLLAQVREEQEK